MLIISRSNNQYISSASGESRQFVVEVFTEEGEYRDIRPGFTYYNILDEEHELLFKECMCTDVAQHYNYADVGKKAYTRTTLTFSFFTCSKWR